MPREIVYLRHGRFKYAALTHLRTVPKTEVQFLRSGPSLVVALQASRVQYLFKRSYVANKKLISVKSEVDRLFSSAPVYPLYYFTLYNCGICNVGRVYIRAIMRPFNTRQNSNIIILTTQTFIFNKKMNQKTNLKIM